MAQVVTWAMAQLSCYYPSQWRTNNQPPEPWHSSVTIILYSDRPATNHLCHGTAQLLLSSAVTDQQPTTCAIAQPTCYYPPQWQTSNQPVPWHSLVAIILYSDRPATNHLCHGTAQLLLSSTVTDQQLTTCAMAQLSCYYPLQWQTSNQPPVPLHSPLAIILCSDRSATNHLCHGTAQLVLSSAVTDQQLTTCAMAQLSCYYPLQWQTSNQPPVPWHSSVAIILCSDRPATNHLCHGTAPSGTASRLYSLLSRISISKIGLWQVTMIWNVQ